jgi:GntR family transcriptional repressor for pyruvate dehydrogenase complex
LLQRVPRTPARAAVVAQVLALLRSGSRRPGDLLPPEPELMRLTGVGRSTVREAIRTLETLQLVEVRQGRGTVVAGRPGDDLDDPHMLLFVSDHRALLDVIEARRAIEPMIARLAAQRATPADVARLGRALATIKAILTRDLPPTAWREAHLEFHAALAHATHNVVATRMWASVATFLRESPLIATSPRADWETAGWPVHERLYEAVARAHVAGALAAMRAHVRDMAAFLGDSARGAQPERPGRTGQAS